MRTATDLVNIRDKLNKHFVLHPQPFRIFLIILSFSSPVFCEKILLITNWLCDEYVLMLFEYQILMSKCQPVLPRLPQVLIFSRTIQLTWYVYGSICTDWHGFQIWKSTIATIACCRIVAFMQFIQTIQIFFPFSLCTLAHGGFY